MSQENLIKAEAVASADVVTYTNTALGQVRVIGDRDNPLFCLKDICDSLDLTNPKNVVNMLINEFGPSLYQTYLGVVTGKKADGTDAIQQVLTTFITEPQLYFVLMRSDKPKAKPFRQWVVNEVLPSIRKTGSYGLPGTYREALAALLEQVDRNERLQAQALEDKPMTDLGKAVSSSKDCINLGQLAVILKQNGIDIGRNKLFKYLRENGYLVNQRGKEHNRPTQRAMDLGLFEVQERVVVINNESCIKFTVKVTPKGQQYFIDLFLKQAV